jgi:hypothetical protein
MSGDVMKSKFLFLLGWKQISCITSILVVLTAALIAQQREQTGAPPPYSGESPAQHAEDVWEAQQHKAMEKKASLQRQQDIRKDTEKLLELATELKQEVDKSNENTLSLGVVKKAEEIEKLAKSVKNKMKGD